jgi:hypothetical protein
MYLGANMNQKHTQSIIAIVKSYYPMTLEHQVRNILLSLRQWLLYVL